jgi:hypothetical protein
MKKRNSVLGGFTTFAVILFLITAISYWIRAGTPIPDNIENTLVIVAVGALFLCALVQSVLFIATIMTKETMTLLSSKEDEKEQ